VGRGRARPLPRGGWHGRGAGDRSDPGGAEKGPGSVGVCYLDGIAHSSPRQFALPQPPYYIGRRRSPGGGGAARTGSPVSRPAGDPGTPRSGHLRQPRPATLAEVDDQSDGDGPSNYPALEAAMATARGRAGMPPIEIQPLGAPGTGLWWCALASFGSRREVRYVPPSLRRPSRSPAPRTAPRFVRRATLALAGECRQVPTRRRLRAAPELMARWDDSSLGRVRDLLSEYQGQRHPPGGTILSLARQEVRTRPSDESPAGHQLREQLEDVGEVGHPPAFTGEARLRPGRRRGGSTRSRRLGWPAERGWT